MGYFDGQLCQWGRVLSLLVLSPALGRCEAVLAELIALDLSWPASSVFSDAARQSLGFAGLATADRAPYSKALLGLVGPSGKDPLQPSFAELRSAQ